MNTHQILALAEQAQTMPDCIDEMTSAEVGAKYHAFIALLTQSLKAIRMVELGVYIGETSKYVAKLNPGCMVIGVDLNPDSMRQLTQIQPIFPNIMAFTDDSVHFAGLYDRTPIDLLFLDVNHDFSLTHSTYEAWKGFVRPGGLIVVDDIHLDGQTKQFNDYLTERDVEMIDVPNVHATGMGVIIT